MKKKIFLFLVVIVFFVFPQKNFATTDNVVDTSQAVYSMYDSFNNDMLVRLYNLSNGSLSDKYYYNQIVNYFKNPDYSYFVTYNTWDGSSYYNSFAFNQQKLYLNFYTKRGLSSSTATTDNWSLIDTQMRELSSSNKIITFEFVSDEVDDLEQASNSTFYLPRILVNYYPSTTVDFVSAINNNDTNLLQQIVSNSSRTADATEKMKEFLENKTVSEESYNQNATTVPDSSSTDLEGTFNTLKNVFTGGTDRDIVLPIPFVNKSITIDTGIVRDGLSNNGGEFIITIVELFYNSLLALWIVKDVNKYITKLKNGSIATSSETNIKADML